MVGRDKEAEGLLADAFKLSPAWRDKTQLALECESRKVLADGSDFYWVHFQQAQCVAQQAEQRERDPSVLPSFDSTDQFTHLQIPYLYEASRLKPDFALAYSEMGHRFGYWQGRGQLREAVVLLLHAMRLEPTASGIHATNLGMVYQHMGQLREAAGLSRREALLLPHNAQAQVELGRGATLIP
jgi:tetratricopeptide (TPR) repeat protein